jgi:hypothetical protein
MIFNIKIYIKSLIWGFITLGLPKSKPYESKNKRKDILNNIKNKSRKKKIPKSGKIKFKVGLSQPR